ncbi:hypothetical protein WR25_23166 [Diploscapter pachys]|uniref:Uncharacterized protein n=1 Tax=Diploscapter pachys TaxID=2018661 RepID=A0A2A2LZW0_9BILA|nr:hypothetical protein WR25_23166 [Diploscapter pachys]
MFLVPFAQLCVFLLAIVLVAKAFRTGYAAFSHLDDLSHGTKRQVETCASFGWHITVVGLLADSFDISHEKVINEYNKSVNERRAIMRTTYPRNKTTERFAKSCRFIDKGYDKFVKGYFQEASSVDRKTSTSKVKKPRHGGGEHNKTVTKALMSRTEEDSKKASKVSKVKMPNTPSSLVAEGRKQGGLDRYWKAARQGNEQEHWLALTCYSCDSMTTCQNPRVEMCPASTQCYTLKQRGTGQVMGLGCALNCQYLPMVTQSMVDCTMCSSMNNCNSGPMNMGIGGGVQPFGGQYNPGQGAQPGGYNNGRQPYSAYNPNQNQGGYGSGSGYNQGSKYGYQPGGGVVPNNQYQPGHGVQPRAANPLSILTVFMIASAVAMIL